MNIEGISVKFEPTGKVVSVTPEARMREAVARAGILLDYPCGGQGTCGKCRVRVMEGAAEPTSVEREAIAPDELEAGYRLACQTRIVSKTVVHVPETSLLASSYQILGGAAAESVRSVDPPVHKQYVELDPPTREEDAPDLQRLQRALGPVQVDAGMLRELPERLRANGFRGTAVMAGDRLIDFEAGNTEGDCYAAAFDIGTTTLVGVLINLATGQECATASRFNPQTAYGDDVLSRILYARDTPGGVTRIQECVAEAIREMIAEMARQADVRTDQIYEATFAGNTTMETLLLGINPGPLGESPFVPAWRGGIEVAAADLGLGIHPRGQAYVFPVIGGFVGGDTVAGLLATEIDESGGPTLFVDIGTNGEIVLYYEGEMHAASCAAGPAFEGARISQGMRAANGAIEKISFNDDVEFSTIGGAPPVGICGSALIDVAAELLRHGIVMSQGMMLPSDSLPDGVPDGLRRRVVAPQGEEAFVIAANDDGADRGPVLLLQQDIRELKLATAAIGAGIAIVLRKAGIGVQDLKSVWVAGGFGNYIRCANAQRIGLLPHGLDESRFFFVGNTALAGARLAAMSRKARQRADALAHDAEHVDLSQDPNFQNEYVEAMFFPE